MEQTIKMDGKKGSLSWGFLAEWIVVAVVMAVMVFGLAPQYFKSREKIHEGEDIQRIQRVRTAVEGITRRLRTILHIRLHSAIRAARWKRSPRS